MVRKNKKNTKRGQNKRKFFGINYTILLCFLLLLIVFVTTALYFFEWNNYVKEKKNTIREIQIDIDERINSVKTLLNYTFFEEEFQRNLTDSFTEGAEVDEKVIYDGLSAISILGSTLKTVWYFPLVDGELSADKKILSNSMLMRFIPDAVEQINANYNNESYYHGEYFYFTLDTALDEVEAKSLLIGHWVLSSSTHNFLEPIGVCVAVANNHILASSFSLIKDSEEVNVGLYTDGGQLIYGYAIQKESDIDQMNVVKMQVFSEYFGIKSILYFDSLQVLYNFLPYVFAIVGIMILLLAIFLIYLKVDERQKTEVYDSFISTFRRISEGKISDRIEEYNIEELDLVSKQFNLMMDSLNILNKALGEEERRAHFNEQEKDRYIIKYLSTQINKHFIFNTFGVIRSFVNLGRADEAAECIDLLCNYLRFTFKGKDYVTVAEEIRAIKDYLDIQKIRLPDINVSISVSDEIKNLQIPQFILQPVVENAYKHAFNQNSGSIVIEGKLDQDMIQFRVSDNGAGISQEKLEKLNQELIANQENDSKEGGIGLINVQRRLKILMGESAFIRVESSEDVGTTIIISCEKK